MLRIAQVFMQFHKLKVGHCCVSGSFYTVVYDMSFDVADSGMYIVCQQKNYI